MKRRDEEQLLNELLAGEEAAEFRRTSLARGLEAVRHRRRRRIRQTAILAALPVLIAAALIFSRTPRPVVPARPEAKAAPLPGKDPISYISDEELFALFPDRAMALIGPAGRQQLVFLDHRAPKHGL